MVWLAGEGQGDGVEAGEDEDGGGDEEEGTGVVFADGLNEQGAGDCSYAPSYVEVGEEAGAGGSESSADEDVASGESGADAEGEEGDVGERVSGEGHDAAANGGDGRSVDDAAAEVVGGDPCSGELSGKAGCEEGSGLSVLNVPLGDEGREQRAEHNGGDASDDEVEKDGSESQDRWLRLEYGLGWVDEVRWQRFDLPFQLG